jgi:hypothetical protein
MEGGMSMYGEFDGPNWRDDPLENTPPVRRSLNDLRDEMRAVARGDAAAAPAPQIGDQCADTDGLAVTRDPLLAALEAFRRGDATVADLMAAFAPAPAPAFPVRALRPLPRVGDMFCLRF